MEKRIIIVVLFLVQTMGGYAQFIDTTQVIYSNDIKELNQHESPQWFNNAKLGIFVHWGLYSVPAFAPRIGTIDDVMYTDSKKWFMNNAYAEWYLNTLRIKGSPTYEYHNNIYGKNYSYYRFSEVFNDEIAKWEPNEMAELFKISGAKYVVLTTKHHDGYSLWPSRVVNPNMPEEAIPIKRDIVGELSKSVRDMGLKMGLYYSGGLDWTYTKTPVLELNDVFGKIRTAQSVGYTCIADAHLTELIEKYKPSILWNDITYPSKGDIPAIISDYYNLVPDGVINDRWGDFKIADFITPEYAKYDSIHWDKWESCRGLGYSFGYNQFEDEKHIIGSTELIHLLIDIVSKNGNLLINVGPKPNGTIPKIQKARLKALGKWMEKNGEAIYNTQPWFTAGTVSESGKKINFTQKDGKLFMIFLSKPSGNEELENMQLLKGTKVRLLGSDQELRWRQEGLKTILYFPENVQGSHAFVLECSKLPIWK